MASAGWGDATTNQKWAEMMGYLWGKMAHRAMTIGEDAAASFVPTDFGAKIEITNFVVGMWPPIDDCTQQPTKLTRARWAEDISVMDWSMAVLKGFILFCKSAEK